MSNKKISSGENDSPLTKQEIDERVATTLWKAVGGFGFLIALALASGMASEKTGPDVLKLIDLNSMRLP